MNSDIYYQSLLSEISAEDIVEGYDLFKNIDSLDSFGQTLLLASCVKQQLENVRYCLKLGANPNFVDECGEAPLHSVIDTASYNEKTSLEIISLLLNAGADIELRAYMDKTPFLRACGRNCFSVIKLLVSSGCNVSAKTTDLGGEFDAVFFARVFELDEEIREYVGKLSRS